MEICQKECPILPNEFENNINNLIYFVSNETSKVNEIINAIIYELKKILP
jgi:hypothetical protein